MSPIPGDCFYLTTEIVLEIHAEAIRCFGGAEGVRDIGLLESAVATPQASFEGQSPFQDLCEVAGAYLFYLCRNHPFVDGNKRTGLGACLVFLRLNGIDPQPDGSEWEALTIGVANSTLDRCETTERLRRLLSTEA